MASFFVFPRNLKQYSREEDFDIEYYPNTSSQHLEERLSSQKMNASQGEKRTLEKMRSRKRKIKSNRRTNKAQRTKYVQSPKGVKKRREKVQQAMLEIERAKREVVRPLVKGKRRHKKVTGTDVQQWLAEKKIGNYSINTIYEDIRALRG